MTTHMRREINEIPEATARLLDVSGADIRRTAAALRAKDPQFLVTIARGSSDHAALFMKYAIELVTGRPVASLGPSLASIYGVSMKLQGAAAICISQSGKSPDIVAMAEGAKSSGALTIALSNSIPSPLSDACDYPLDLQAGPELAVAATKSFVTSIVAGLAVLAEWVDDAELRSAVRRLPADFEKAVALDWQDIAADLQDTSSLYMLGRGPTLAIASEAALKFKETSERHAEAYSAAEVLHGPVALVGQRFPVIAFAARDAAEASIAACADGLQSKGAMVRATSAAVSAAHTLPFVATGHPLTDALSLIIPFYGFVESWSRASGFDPDAPASLKKVTETR